MTHLKQQREGCIDDGHTEKAVSGIMLHFRFWQNEVVFELAIGPRAVHARISLSGYLRHFFSDLKINFTTEFSQ